MYDTFNLGDTLDEIKVAYAKLKNKNIELLNDIAEQQKLLDGAQYKYVIDRQTFTQCMTVITDYIKAMDDIHKVGICLNIPSFDNIITEFLHLLSKCVNDPIDQPHVRSDLEYFVYDLECGKNYTEGCATQNGVNLDMSSVEAMWHYFSNYTMKLNELNKETK